MAIPNPDEWIDQTSHPDKPKPRGHLAKVDALIEEWDDASKSPSPDVKLGVLCDLLKAAAKAYEKLGVKGNGYTRFLRREALEKLREEIFAEFERIIPGFWLGMERFKARKAQGPYAGTIPLHGKYAYERRHYLSTKKRFAHSASIVGDTLGEIQGVDQKRKDLRRIQKKTFATLNYQDYETLAQKSGGRRVQYYRKLHRLKYMVIPDEQGKLVTLDGDPAHTSRFSKASGIADLFMYAIDRYGNIFVKSPISARGEDLLNHSTLNAGREVMCAGCIWIWEGRLRHIDNNSGHYKPSTLQLRNALDYLIDIGIDLSETRVVDFCVPGRQEFFALSWLNGATVPDYTIEDEWRNTLRLGRQS